MRGLAPEVATGVAGSFRGFASLARTVHVDDVGEGFVGIVVDLDRGLGSGGTAKVEESL